MSILVLWNGEVKSRTLLLMTGMQPTQNKARLAMDFRELNDYVSCYTGNEVADICEEILR